MVKLFTKKLYDDAILPLKKRDSDEGYDIFAYDTITLPKMKVTKIHTGIIAWASEIKTVYTSNKPKDLEFAHYWLQIEGRSGLASNGIFPLGGIVDSSYRGEIIVMLANFSDEGYTIHKNDKIAQLIIRNKINAIVSEVFEIAETDRGDKGFGSSGR